MPSLTAHLRSDAHHDRLPFHPSCPICRETRASGAIASGSVVSVRTQAVLTAGLLAVSASAPTVSAVAAETDTDTEGTAPVAQAAPPGTNADFDPGGAGTALPETAAQPTTPAGEAAGETTAVEQPPNTDPREPVADEGDGDGALGAGAAAPTPTDATTPPAAPAAPAVPTPAEPTTTVTPATPEPAPVSAAADLEPAPQQPSELAPKRRPSVRAKPTPRPVVPAPVAAPAPATAQVPIQAPVARVAKADRAQPGDRAHTVVAGESLWAVASDLLGGDASAAQIAREVHRLWQMNSQRIGTGVPDLLPVGTRLVLR